MRLVEKPRRTRGGRKPQAVDVHVGMRIRLCRTSLGISDKQLSEAIGVACEQMQKFECGAAHIDPVRIFDVAVALNTPIHFFFDDTDEPVLSPGRPERS